MNVETSLIFQLACFCLCGIFLGLGYELLRIIRLIIPHHSFTVGVEDTFYLSLCGLIIFGLSMEIGNGNFRSSYLVAAFIGAAVYFLTIGRIIKLIYSVIINTMIKMLKFILRKLLKPLTDSFVSIAHKLKQPFVKLYENIKAKMKKHRAGLKNTPEMIYNNDIELERNEQSDVIKIGRIKGKVGKIQ